MADGMQKDWRELCVALTNESDPTKLSSLVQREPNGSTDGQAKKSSAGQSTKFFTLSFPFLCRKSCRPTAGRTSFATQRRAATKITVASRWTTLRDRNGKSVGLAGK